jgi:pSer/pThr/pTyr-binding forkhead associated (FHA) protein
LRITSSAETDREFPLTAEETLIGQSAECGVALTFDRFVSPEHACIRRDGDRHVLEDRGSRNGVYVRLEGPVELRAGMEILIGTTRLRVCSPEEP